VIFMPSEHFTPGVEEGVTNFGFKKIITEKKESSPADYIAEEREILAEIEEKAKEIPHDDLIALVGRVFEHSSEAGLGLVEGLRLPPEDVEKMVLAPAFHLKHIELCKALSNKIVLHQSKNDPTSSTVLKGVQDAFLNRSEQVFEHKRTKPKKEHDSKTENLLFKIDHHFLKALSQRKVTVNAREEASSNDYPKQSKGEVLAEEALIREQRVLEGAVYGGMLRDFILQKGLEQYPEYFKKIAKKLAEKYPKSKGQPGGYSSASEALKDIQKGNVPEQIQIVCDFLEYVRSVRNTLDLNLVAPFDDFLQRDLNSDVYHIRTLLFGLGVPADEQERFLKKAKYQPGIAPAAESKAQLKKEIIKSVQSRYPGKEVEIVLDEKTGDYIINKSQEAGPQIEAESEMFRKEIVQEIEDNLKKDGYSVFEGFVHACYLGDLTLMKKAWFHERFHGKVIKGSHDIRDLCRALLDFAERMSKPAETELFNQIMQDISQFPIINNDSQSFVKLFANYGNKENVEKLLVRAQNNDLVYKGGGDVWNAHIKKEETESHQDDRDDEANYFASICLIARLSDLGENELVKELFENQWEQFEHYSRNMPHYTGIYEDFYPGLRRILNIAGDQAVKKVEQLLIEEEEKTHYENYGISALELALDFNHEKTAKKILKKFNINIERVCWLLHRFKGGYLLGKLVDMGERGPVEKFFNDIFKKNSAENFLNPDEVDLMVNLACALGDDAKRMVIKWFEKNAERLHGLSITTLQELGDYNLLNQYIVSHVNRYFPTAEDSSFGDVACVNIVKDINEPDIVKIIYNSEHISKRQRYLAEAKLLKLLESKHQEPREMLLSSEERSKLDLLNLVQHRKLNKKERLGEIDKYFRGKYGQDKGWVDRTKEFLSQSNQVAQGVNQIIASNPEMVMETMAAVPDLNIEQTSQRILLKLFPELAAKPPKKSFWSKFFGRLGERGPSPDFSLTPEDESSLEGGDPMQKSPEAIKMREFSDKFIATDTFGKYNSATKKWEKVYFSIPQDVGEPAVTRTFTLSHPPKGRAGLPKPLGAKIIPERAFAVDKNGNRIQLTIEENSLGEATTNLPPNTESVLYSFLESQVELPLKGVTHGDLERNYRKLSADTRKFLTEKLGPLPAECKLFISSIKDKPPKEKLVLIERFVKQISYYDFDNREMQETKKDKNMKETLAIMEARMNELIKRNPKMAETMRGKKYAGVCADFSKLTAMLLREAGFASGVMLGFAPHDQSVKLHEFHALNFVLYPSGIRDSRPVLLDATPVGLTADEEKHLAGVRLPSFEEREQGAKEDLTKMQEEIGQRLEKILDIVKSQDKTAIQQLSNGELENIVNTILHYEVRQDNFKRVLTTLEAFWYTPYKDADIKTAGEFISGELKNVKAQEEFSQEQKNAGHEFFELLEDYVRKFKKAGKAKTDAEALDLMQNIFDSIESDLTPVESRAVAAVITYLKAKKKL